MQLIQEGTAPRKYTVGTGRVGIDIGTSSIATVSDIACHLDTIGDNVVLIEKEIKHLNRKLDRSRRKSNPKNYNADGTIKRDTKHGFTAKTINALCASQHRCSGNVRLP